MGAHLRCIPGFVQPCLVSDLPDAMRFTDIEIDVVSIVCMQFIAPDGDIEPRPGGLDNLFE